MTPSDVKHNPKRGTARADIDSMHVLGNRIFIQMDPVVEKIGLLYIPDECKEDTQTGTVISVGNGVRAKSKRFETAAHKPIFNGARVPLDVKVGDRVMVAQYNGTNLELNGEKFVGAREDEIMGTLDAEDNFVPLHNQVVIQPDTPEQMAGSLFLPEDRAGKHEETGTVVAVGCGWKNRDGSYSPLDVQVGDRVVYARLAGERHPIKKNGAKMALLPVEHIYAVLEAAA
jgi:chaperonin GroES